MTPAEPSDGEKSAPKQTVQSKRLMCVLAASRLKATPEARPGQKVNQGRQEPTIE